MRDFGLSLRGRVKNFPLPENKSLIPLFEAVVNSLQAIAERQKTCDFLGEISILIERNVEKMKNVIDYIQSCLKVTDINGESMIISPISSDFIKEVYSEPYNK